MPLSNTVALVTGATSGIGFHTATALASRGATVYITGRDERRGDEAQRAIRIAANHFDVHFIQSDASTVGANQLLARELRARTGQLDILINNVGAAYNDRTITADGYEATLAMHVVGPFALTDALLPLLAHSEHARIVNVVSAAIGMWKGDPFDDVHSERDFLGSRAYARSKFLNVLWSFALSRRLAADDIVVTAVDPGTAWTRMTAGIERRGMPSWVSLIWPLFRWLQRRGTAEAAARSSIHAATSTDTDTLRGAYIGADTRPGRLPRPLRNEDLQEQTWRVIEQMVVDAPTALSAMEAVL